MLSFFSSDYLYRVQLVFLNDLRAKIKTSFLDP